MAKTGLIGMDDEAVSPVIGVVLMVAITVILAGIVFVLVSDLADVDDQPPRLAFRSDGDAYVVYQATHDVLWGDLDVEGCQVVPTGAVEAGDRMEECTDPVTVRHIPSNSLVWSS